MPSNPFYLPAPVRDAISTLLEIICLGSFLTAIALLATAAGA
jgi:hypothetical protein